MAGDSTEKDTDVTGEFFSVGAPLHAVRAGYIRRRADEQLYNALVSGHYAHVVAPERSGKSSLIAATAARLESSGFKVAILDLEQIGDRDGGTDSGRWYYSVAYRLQRQLRIRFDLQSWWQDKTVLSNRQRLFEFYSEVVLQNVSESIVIFVDGIQCIEDLPYADQFLTSIRAAHNARTTDPDFSRLSFVLLGECDPVSLMQEAELSPFNVTQQVLLSDFSRSDLDLFATELNLENDDAVRALDRIYYWTKGQPYLSQKLARAVAREPAEENIEEQVDRIATLQVGGRAALHSEPHMSHIHRSIMKDKKRCEPLLNLYGKIRKGIEVPADLGSQPQRRLMALGLLVIDEESNVSIRNRLYEHVFTARWANENLPTYFKVPAIVAAAMLLFTMIPFWYTQWLPGPYVRTLAADDTELSVATAAYENFRSFPGHADTAENLYRNFLGRRALVSSDELEIRQLAALVEDLPNAGRLAAQFEADFWDRRSSLATRQENRDDALLAKIQSLVLPTAVRRQRAATLVSDDYPYLLSTLPAIPSGTTVFDPVGMILTTAVGAEISQFSYTPQGIQAREPWTVTALEVSPLVRRVIVDREGSVGRIGLTLNVSHSRFSDLRIKIIAPSGRAVEIETGLDKASSNDDIQISGQQLGGLIGESLSGTWSISVRDEAVGVAGQLVGWNLKLNSQGAIEHFQRGLNIPDPVERETDSIWFDSSGRYAVARATQSDSARIWDLAFADPVRAIALPESEVLIGLNATARRLVTATQDRVNLWDTATGDRVMVIPVGTGSISAVLTPDRTHLFVERRGDIESRLELWDLDNGKLAAEVVVAGVPALVAIDAAGSRVAIADFDRAVRIWDFQTSELLGQFDLPAQPGTIDLSADGSMLGVVYPNVGLSIWSVSLPQQPMHERLGDGNWQIAFSPSGNRVLAGRHDIGFQIFSGENGVLIGPPLGVRNDGPAEDLLAFSQDEQLLLTGRAKDKLRFWRVPVSRPSSAEAEQQSAHVIWNSSADSTLTVAPDGRFIAIGDPAGHVHFIPSGASLTDVAEMSADVSFVGHSSEVMHVGVDPSGSLAVSVAVDNSLRLWDTGTGEPRPYVIDVSGPPVSYLEFSPDSGSIGVLSGSRVTVIKVEDGRIVAEHDAGLPYNGMTFASESELYLGGQNGELQLLRRAVDGHWSPQQVWKSENGIRRLSASPRGDFLILIDQNNLASQFRLSDGLIGDATLQLPADVEEVAFDRNGSRAYFRTARWLHRAGSSASGLTWMDAIFVSPALDGARIVHGNGSSEPTARKRMYLPAARNGFVELVELSFDGSSSTGLFGNKDGLLKEWRERINAIPLEGS